MALRFSDPALMRHPKRDVTCCTVAKGQSLVATGTQDGVVVLWEAGDGAQLVRMEGGHKGPVTSVSFNGETTVLASCGEDGGLNLWDVSHLGDGVKFRKLEGHGSPMMCLVFSPNSALLATGAQDSDIILWGNLGRPVSHRLRAHNNWVTCLAFSGNSNLLVSGGFDHAVCLWNTTSFSLVRTLRHHMTPVGAIALSVEGSVVASGDEEGVVLLTRASDGACLRVLRGHLEMVTGLSFVEGMGILFSCSRDSSVKAWSMRGQCIKSFRAHEGGALSLCVSKESDLLVTTGDDFLAKGWPFIWREEDIEFGLDDDCDS